MTDDTIVCVSQEHETPVVAEQRREFGYRYAYSRSADSQSHHDKGQDYLTFRENEQRLVFALCDGVSQSFYGDLAAHLLGDALVYWLWKKIRAKPETLQKDLEEFLDSLVEPASKQVETYPIPSDLAPMIYQVLEQKRAVGSESTFVAGLFDFATGQLFLAWMGDSRLRLWGKDGETTDRLGDAFHTQERWSTRRGRIGDLHTFSMPLRDLRYLIAYSDGLVRLDKTMARHLRDFSINAVIDYALLRPESDDTSFFEVWVGNERPIERPPLPAPLDVKLEIEEGRARVRWRPVAGAAFYEVRLADGQSFTVYAPGRLLEFPKDTLKVDARTLCLRAWDDEPGNWSAELPIAQELRQPVTPLIEPTPVIPPRTEPVASTPVSFPTPHAPVPHCRQSPPPPPSPVPARTPRFRFIFSGLTVLLTCCLAVTLLLWPGSPLSAIFFPSPTPVPMPTKIPPTPIPLTRQISTVVPITSTSEMIPTTRTPSAISFFTETPFSVSPQMPGILSFCVNVDTARIRTAPGIDNPEKVADKLLSLGTCLNFDMYALDKFQIFWIRIAPNQLGFEDLGGGWVSSKLLNPPPEYESWQTLLSLVTLTPIPSPTLTPSQTPPASITPPITP